MEQSSELMLGVIRTVGTDCNAIFDYIKRLLDSFGFKLETIKVSSLILNEFSDRPDNSFSNLGDRTEYYMDLGNEIRRLTNDGAVLARGVAAYVHSEFRDRELKANERTVYMVDSLKHPKEVAFLRDLYGDGFHLIGISGNRRSRINYLVDRKGMKPEQAERLVNRDEYEADENGQHTRDAYQEADYFIDASASPERQNASVERLLSLLFGDSFITPTFEEYAMFRAFVASLRSADMSRQVGAVVAYGDDIVGEGVNDCPKAGGGLYWPVFNEGFKKYHDVPSGRDHTLGTDYNRQQQEEMAKSILITLGQDASQENVDLVRKAGLGRLTEFGRMVHAEMEALIMCARNGISTRGCTMFVTTFPCHNCAKHILAAGIKRVVYIEPYPKSKALESFANEIVSGENSDGQNGKILFEPFYGVGPHKFVDLFAMRSTRWRTRVRKNDLGEKVEWNHSDAALRTPMMPITYLEAEQAAYVTYNREVAKAKEAIDA